MGRALRDPGSKPLGQSTSEAQLDAVLPLIARDVPRFELLYRSLRRHVRGLDRVLVVVPDAELRSLELKPAADGPALEVVSELALVPELAAFSGLNGWYRQQLVKLSAAEHVASDFYLTLDADVIATHAVDLNALCAAGTAPCGVVHADLHPRWYDGAEALIGAPLPRREISHTVTPAILHRDAVRALCEHLERRWRDHAYSAGLRGWKQRFGRLYSLTRANRKDLRPWRILLCWSRPWAEYSLYFSYLEWCGQFSTYHHETSEALYAEKRSVWHPQDLETWSPASLAVSGPPFVVLQSTAGIPIETLRAWVEPFV